MIKPAFVFDGRNILDHQALRDRLQRLPDREEADESLLMRVSGGVNVLKDASFRSMTVKSEGAKKYRCFIVSVNGVRKTNGSPGCHRRINIW